MARYIAKRLVYMVLVFFLLTFILFVLYQMMPANRAYTDARTEIQTMKRLSEEEKATKFDELYLKYQMTGIIPASSRETLASPTTTTCRLWKWCLLICATHSSSA